MGILLVIVLLAWQCASGDDAPSATKGSTTTTTNAASPTTTVATVPTSVTAVALSTNLPQGRSLAAAATAGNSLVVAGGINDKRTSMTTIWLIDPVSGKVSDVGALPAAAHSVAAAPIGTAAVFMGGSKGDTVFKSVTPVTADGVASSTASLPTNRTDATAITAADGSATYIVGGFDGTNPTNEVLKTTDGQTFTTVATLTHPVRFPAVALLGQSIWVMGGEYDKTITKGVQRVDLGADGAASQAVDAQPLPVELSRAVAFTLSGSVFIAGGRTTDSRSNQIYRLDPTIGQFTAAGSLPSGWSDAAVAVIGSTAYIVGGISTGKDKAGAPIPVVSKEILALTTSP